MELELFANLQPEPQAESGTPSKIVRLIWAGAEAARQLVFRNCLKLMAGTPSESRQQVAERYLSSALSAIDGAAKERNA